MVAMRRSNKQNRKKKISSMGRILLTLLGIVIIGDLLGAMLFLRQPGDVQSELVYYIVNETTTSATFWQIFTQQAFYQLTIGGFGITLVGNVMSLFMLFIRGVGAGFNLTFLIREVGFSNGGAVIILAWLFQYVFVLFVTILNLYFGLRFLFHVFKCLQQKKYRRIVVDLKAYGVQMVMIIILTFFSATVTRLLQPVFSQMFY